MSDADSIVFVVDDDDSLRRSLERLLRVTGHNVEAFSSAAAFLQRPEPDVPCCLILDIRMPTLTGLDVQRAINESGRPMPIVLMTGFADVESCVVGMKGGAADFLLKPFDEDQLLRAVTAGLIQSVELRRARQVRGELENRLIALTPRENQVFWLVVKGMLNKQIAAHLGTKEGTVKLHRANVMRKLHAQSVADLVRIADRLETPAASPARGGDFTYSRQDTAQLA
ncbi:MAG TPA: response regulator [Gemmatimonadaceae bacterium]|jgi:FixJ family two-component response regulator|nr:response regulator [Gemmatimonadaceae bacterium]